jgi:hypothetical protein|tara:strand:- start:1626 stop:1871 length:246 start_codon:yes stop_codon:yes gene_type:complete
MAEILIPIAGMLFVLTVIFGGRLLQSLDSYLKVRQAASSEEIQDRLDQMDDLEERMRVVEAVITEENYQLKKKFEDLERGE